MSKHIVEIREYDAVDGRGFRHTVRHQRHLYVDGHWVGYCPTSRGSVVIAGSVPAEVREAVEAKAAEFWADDGGDAAVSQLVSVEATATEFEEDDE